MACSCTITLSECKIAIKWSGTCSTKQLTLHLKHLGVSVYHHWWHSWFVNCLGKKIYLQRTVSWIAFNKMKVSLQQWYNACGICNIVKIRWRYYTLFKSTCSSFTTNDSFKFDRATIINIIIIINTSNNYKCELTSAIIAYQHRVHKCKNTAVYPVDITPLHTQENARMKNYTAMTAVWLTLQSKSTLLHSEVPAPSEVYSAIFIPAP